MRRSSAQRVALNIPVASLPARPLTRNGTSDTFLACSACSSSSRICSIPLQLPLFWLIARFCCLSKCAIAAAINAVADERSGPRSVEATVSLIGTTAARSNIQSASCRLASTTGTRRSLLIRAHRLKSKFSGSLVSQISPSTSFCWSRAQAAEEMVAPDNRPASKARKINLLTECSLAMRMCDLTGYFVGPELQDRPSVGNLGASGQGDDARGASRGQATGVDP